MSMMAKGTKKTTPQPDVPATGPGGSTETVKQPGDSI